MYQIRSEIFQYHRRSTASQNHKLLQEIFSPLERSISGLFNLSGDSSLLSANATEQKRSQLPGYRDLFLRSTGQCLEFVTGTRCIPLAWERRLPTPMASLEQRLSLSTCWCSHRHSDGFEMLEEMRELGFAQVELSHGIRMDLVPGIIRAHKEGLVQFSSIHNFCPLPSSAMGAAPNLFEPSSTAKKESMLWDRYTTRTIEFAEQIGASAMVIHSGSYRPAFRSPRAALEELPEPSNENQRKDALDRLLRKAGRPTQRVVENFQTLTEKATKAGVTVGVENREDVLELPIDSKFEEFLSEFPKDSPFAYWHDTGHARIKERLGLLDHREHLEKMSPRLAGFHLHDVNEDGKDHQTPGTGSIDFHMIREFVRPEHILVAELSPRLSREEVLQSRDTLLQILG